MKKSISSYLVIVLTIMTVIAMSTLGKLDTIETSKNPDDVFQPDDKPDGTGLIFDDYGENINIPYKPAHKDDNKKENKEDKSSKESSVKRSRALSYKINQLMDIYNEDLSYYAVMDKSSKPYDYNEYLKYYNKPVINEVYIENQIAMLEEEMNAVDRVYLLKASSKLNDDDLTVLKMAINYNNSENVEKLMIILRKKLSISEFDKVKFIFNKYNLL